MRLSGFIIRFSQLVRLFTPVYSGPGGGRIYPLARPWPKGEWLVAEALGISPKRAGPRRFFPMQRVKLF
ncbi:helix-turn-helix domain-containing protein [Brenneria sp. 4F2]|nr:helix-turn-helix domain-containing protein [Brenneria bubanii]